MLDIVPPKNSTIVRTADIIQQQLEKPANSRGGRRRPRQTKSVAFLSIDNPVTGLYIGYIPPGFATSPTGRRRDPSPSFFPTSLSEVFAVIPGKDRE